MKILLICAGGISTSLIARNRQKHAKELLLDIQVDAIGEAFDLDNRDDKIKKADIILLAPQIRYLHKMIQEVAGSAPVVNIGIQQYVLKNTK